MTSTIKKVGAIFAALLMLFSMTSILVGLSAKPAFAAAGDITVNGAIKDATYTAYKVFDATSNGDAVSYTIPADSPLAGQVNTDEFKAVFNTQSNGGVTYVTKKDGANDADVINYLKSQDTLIATSDNQKATVTNSNGDASVALATGGEGYYYIKATIGTEGQTGFKTAVTIDSAHPTATVNSKITDIPSIPEDGKKVNGKTVNTMEVGETGTFTLTFNATNYAVTNNDPTKITSYTVVDTMDGFGISDDQLADLTVKVGDANLTRIESNDAPYFSAEKTENGLQVVIHNYDKGSYTSPSQVVVSYEATLTNKNVVNESTNSFTVKYNNTTAPGNPGTKTYNYKVVIDKYASGNESAKLSGAKFVLKDGNGADAKFYSVDAKTGVVSWVNDQSQATEVTTDDKGAASFQGLKAGTYYLFETQAPAGYNLLTEPTTVTLQEISTDQAKGDDGTIAALSQTAEVANSQGGTLPSTGGMGTTVLYAAGALLVAAAAVLLITRKRMRDQQ